MYRLQQFFRLQICWFIDFFWEKQGNIRCRSNVFVHGDSQYAENPNACVYRESQRAENLNVCMHGDYQRADTTEISVFWYISNKICIKIRFELWKYRIYEGSFRMFRLSCPDIAPTEFVDFIDFFNFYQNLAPTKLSICNANNMLNKCSLYVDDFQHQWCIIRKLMAEKHHITSLEKHYFDKIYPKLCLITNILFHFENIFFLKIYFNSLIDRD